MTARMKTLMLITALGSILISAGVLILAFRPATGQKGAALFPIIENGKYGYIDRTGKVIIKPQFDTAKRFSEGLARVRVDNKWGFIDPAGRIVIQPQFELESNDHDNDPSLDFHEGMAAVSRAKGSKWGYIDQTGKTIITPKYGMVSRFSEGIAQVYIEYPVTIRQDFPHRSSEPVIHSAYIDKTGKNLNFPLVGESFSEGLAVVSQGKDVEDRKQGYIDKAGQVRIEPQFAIARPFREELACVRPTNTNEWGYIDKTGKMVIQPRSFNQERGAGDFHEGLAPMNLTVDRWGFIDKTGKLAIQPGFLMVGRFSDGVAGACVEDATADSGEGGATCGYIGRTGEWVIQHISTRGVMSDFYEGLALVCGEDFCGYINKKGDYVWRAKQRFDPWRLTGCTVWNLGEPDYGEDSCRH